MQSSWSGKSTTVYPFARSFEEFQEMFWNAPVGIFRSTPEGRFVSANPAWAEMCGYSSPRELIESVTDIASQIYAGPEERERFKRRLELCGYVVDYEYRLCRPDGSVLWVAENVRAVQDDQGRVCYQGIAIDISRRKLAEDALRSSEERFFKAFRSSPAPQVISEIQTGRFVDVNDRWVEMLGWDREEMIGRNSKEVGIWGDPGERDRIVGTMQSRGYFKDQPIVFRTKQGRMVEALWSAEKIVLDGQELMLSMIQDETERKKVVRELEENYRFLDTVLDTIQDGVCVLDRDFRIIKVNQTMEEWYHLKRPLEGKTCYQVFHDRAELCSCCPATRALETHRMEMKTMAFDHQGSAGGTAEIYAQPLFDATGQPKYIVEYVRDITTHKQAEEALRQKNEEKSVLLDCIPTQLWYLPDEATYGAVNQAHADFVGLDKTVMEFQPIDRVLSPEETEVCRRSNLEVYATRRPYTAEEWLYNAHGERRLLAIVKTPKLNEQGEVEYVVCSGTDITEQKQYEQELQYLSFHDQLTGLHNRAFLEAELQRLEQSREYPITIICMDLDGLKLVNDSLGHEYGDRHLKSCAEVIQGSFRASDIVARVGGDEFVALLPTTSREAGDRIIDRIQEAVGEYNQTWQPTVPLGLSIGLACAQDREQALSQVYKQADDLMYRDKLNRNTNTQSQIMTALMAALEERDFVTSGHVHRLEDLCRELGRKSGLSSTQLSDLNLLAQMHDLGKVGIPDHILFKPGPLTEEEWKIMRQHPEKGYRIALATKDLAGIADLILKHHERWDGTGYPLGLAGEDIPIECRILAVVDSFDAMTNDRPYRKAMPVDQALEELAQGAGTHFDPALVHAFMDMMRTGEISRG